ncbi:MAG: response regulator transcription factor [Anaerolineae bacterium]|nr:MAG: response regulator transcription factor [Anaerolineae bacterium]
MPTDDLQALSEREIDILKLLATGASNQEIARALVISPNTVKVHLRNIYEKLQVQSRTEATLVAIRAGLVAVETPASPVVELSAPPSTVAPVARPPWRRRGPTGRRRGRSRGQRVFLLVIVGLSLAALLLPWLQAVASQPAVHQVDLITDAQAPARVLPIRQETPRWQMQAPLPGPRSRLALASFHNQLYAIGAKRLPVSRVRSTPTCRSVTSGSRAATCRDHWPISRPLNSRT